MNNYNPKRPRPTPTSSAAAQVDGLIGPAPEEVIEVADKAANQSAETTSPQEQAAQERSPESAEQPDSQPVDAESAVESDSSAAEERPHHLEVVSDMDLPTAGQVAVAEPPKGKIIAAIVASGLGVSAAAVAIWWWITQRNNKN